MTKQEKRLFIRDVAKYMFASCSSNDYKLTPLTLAKHCVNSAVVLSDELESFERKQDEEDCEDFGKKNSCYKSFCSVREQCQSKRGAK